MVRNLANSQSASGNYQATPQLSFRNPQSEIRNRPQGLTLIEMLIGMAITLVMMAAVVNLFANIGSGIRVRRASMEMSSQLRMARARLFKDLAGATCAARPKLETDDHNDGYIEIIDGQFSDKYPTDLTIDPAASLIPSSQTVAAGNVTDGRGLGDFDDVLALTVRSENEPFVGRWTDNLGNVRTIESNLAEVIWYAVENPDDGSLGEPGMRTIYRRVLLVAPWIQGSLDAPIGGNLSADLLAFYNKNDISVHRTGTGPPFTWVPNTLSDLTKRENRFGHFLDTSGGFGFPFTLNQSAIRASTYDPASPPLNDFGPLRPFGPPFDSTADSEERQGEDVMLNDVLAFDLRVFDSEAQLIDFGNSGNVVGPSDAGWRHNYDTGLNPIAGAGAYVDLNYGEKYLDYASLVGITPMPTGNDLVETQFYDAPLQKSQLSFGVPYGGVYDTWSFHYENDGLDTDDRDSDGDTTTGVDEGTNGLDDPDPISGVPENGTDDVGERETAPPYDVPLRGIQVKLRIYERDTRQIREATVTRGFVP